MVGQGTEGFEKIGGRNWATSSPRSKVLEAFFGEQKVNFDLCDHKVKNRARGRYTGTSFILLFGT